MRISMKAKLLPLLALTFIVCTFLLAKSTTAYAADIHAETLSVDEVWLTGDTLHITVTDKKDGASRSLELNLSDYAKADDEYITVQATDNSGRTSNVIQFKNPYHVSKSDADSSGGGASPSPSGITYEDAIPSINSPFTPDGTGTVMDRATDSDGKEFFTVKTTDGNVFYLIVDRERSIDNVYLLNAVTEDDLVSLAKQGSSGSVSAAQTPEADVQAIPPEIQKEESPAPPPAQNGSSNTTVIAFIVIAAACACGAGYYIKVVRPKKQEISDDDDYGDEPEYGEEFEDEATALADEEEEDDE